MRPDILIKVRYDFNLYSYLKYHSYWYKELIRNPNSLVNMENEMKKEYKLTTSDKINRLNDRVAMVRSFLDVIK